MQSNQQECGWQLNRADVTSVTSTFHPSSSSNILRASLIASRPCCTKNSWSFFDGGGCFKSSRLASVKDSSLWSSTAMIFFFLKEVTKPKEYVSFLPSHFNPACALMWCWISPHLCRWFISWPITATAVRWRPAWLTWEKKKKPQYSYLDWSVCMKIEKRILLLQFTESVLPATLLRWG